MVTNKSGRSAQRGPPRHGSNGQGQATTSASPFAVVAIGASAGGLDAFTQLLGALPGDTGMAFVVIQHLDPRHPSMLTDILARSTTMPVVEVQDGMKLQPNHVFVIAPNTDMLVSHDVLELSPRTESRGQHRPIDRFLISLSHDRAHRAIGVILSGTASDGTQGMAAIKAEGGITFAQDASATQGSMPRSAIATGAIDHVLPPVEIAHEIARIGRHPHFAQTVWRPEEPKRQADFGQVVELLATTTGVDFAHYRSTTLYRRITRRMALQHIERMSEYLSLLRTRPAELEALYNDILINVTRFFRDPESYDYLKSEVLPGLARGRRGQGPIRIWVPGCSTGEEAYSIAIMISEHMASTGVASAVQIYATDLNHKGIDKARTGLYGRDIAHDVSPERLRGFFAEVEGGYRVSKTIRDMCVFATQNVLNDPPFSHMDLISCRNMLIYLDPVLQRRVLPTLHYALNPEGVLWLGSSESIGTFAHLFDTMDAKHKVFLKKSGPAPAPARRVTGSPRMLASERTHGPKERVSILDDDLLRVADRAVIARFVPVGVLVDGNLEILQFRGDTSPFLAPASGRASLNLYKMAREGLVIPLRAALARAKSEVRPIREASVVRTPQGRRDVAFEVMPIKGSDSEETSYIVTFEDRGEASAPRPTPRKARANAKDPQVPEAEREITRLTQELAATREYLQSVNEQQEAANEVLQSANEEVQSANEELQSLNEELETSKEEIQSTNEELNTVNDELQNRITELHRLNHDLNNLLVNVQMAVVILGPDQRIRRFTNTAERVLHLTAADVNRPIGDLNLPLDIPEVGPMLAEVMATFVPQEHAVQDREGTWYLLRIRAYKAPDDRVDGAVLMLVDIDAQQRHQMELEEAREFAETIVATAREPLVVLDEVFRIHTASSAFCDAISTTRPQIEGRPFFEIHGGQWDHPELRSLVESTLSTNRPARAVRIELTFERQGRRIMLFNIEVIHRRSVAGPLVLLAIEDVTEQAQLEAALRMRIDELAQGDRNKNEFLAMLAHELRNPLAPVSNATHILNASEATPEMRAQAGAMIARQVQHMKRLIDDLLDVSRITRGSIKIHTEPVILNTVLQRTIEMGRGSLADRRCELTLSVPVDPVVVLGDPTRLEQVFGNLVNNSCKFVNEDGHIAVSLERQAASFPESAEEAVIRVQDDGIGISAEMLPRIFDLFAQADHSLERRKGGLGIGLTLVRRLVELQGGWVEAHSAGVNQGSEFVVHLPIASHAATPAEPPPTESVPAKQSLRILVVEDNEDGAKILGMVLGMIGHQVRIAGDGPGAIAAVATFSPDVVLLDIGLPGMSGYEVARTLRLLPGARNAVMVALTGYGRDEDLRDSRESGFDHHLTKPVAPPELQKLLESVVRSPGRQVEAASDSVRAS